MGRKYTPFKSNEEFQNAITKIASELYAAAINYDLYSHLVNLSQKYKKEYFRGRQFWGMVQDGFLLQAVMTLCRVYDIDDDRTNSLETILRRQMKTNMNRAGIADMQADIQLVGRSDPVVSRLRGWRNHALAHTNQGFAIRDEKLPKSMIPFRDELMLLIDRGTDIVLRNGGASVSRDLSHEYVPRKEIDFVFESIKEKMNYTKAEIRVWLEKNGINPDVLLDHEKQK